MYYYYFFIVRMTYARDVSFGSLPYGFVLAKGNPELKEELNKV